MCLGDAPRASKLLEKLGPQEMYGVPRALMVFHLVQGKEDKAVEWLDRMIDQRDVWVSVIVHMPYGKGLRDDPRWPALAKRMNLPVGSGAP
jgi:hypothetical protein